MVGASRVGWSALVGCFIVAVAIVPVFGLMAAEQSSPSPALGAMRYRALDFTRGGRVTAVTGVPTQPLVYYFGSTGGGVWKTTDAGVTWQNVSIHS